MSTVKHVADYLAARKRPSLPGVCCLFGDEPFFKQLALEVIRRQVVVDEEAELSESRFSGQDAELRDVLDALSTASLFDAAGRRLVIVDGADDFVSGNRAELEDYAGRPRSTGVLVLDVKKWPRNTRLFKRLAETGLQLDCSTPSDAVLARWLTHRSREPHQARLDVAAAELLIEIIGPLPGVLDQELAKLATCVDTGRPITAEMVSTLAGGGRLQTAWQMLDAALAGDAAVALVQLDRLLLAGEHPIALLAQIASTLRRFAAACRLVEEAEAAGRPVALRQALDEAGVRNFAISKAERQLRRLGRRRAGQLYRLLLEADLALKGGSELDGRVVMEQLLTRLAAPADAPSRSQREHAVG